MTQKQSRKYMQSYKIIRTLFLLVLKPGMQLVFDGFTIEEGVNVPHSVVITITDLTKVIGGVRSTVTWDLHYSNGELIEAELAFFAQDTDGVDWRMGEYLEKYENVLVIAETSVSEIGAFQLKSSAPGVGNIRTDWCGEDQTQETLDLVEYNQLTPTQMKEVRAKAFEMEKHAYEVSKDVYGKTSPMEQKKSLRIRPRSWVPFQ